MTGGIVEDYKVSVFRPEGVTVAYMNAFIKAAVIDFAWGTGHAGNNMKQVAQHPVKVSREHPEHTHRKHALID